MITYDLGNGFKLQVKNEHPIYNDSFALENLTNKIQEIIEQELKDWENNNE